MNFLKNSIKQNKVIKNGHYNLQMNDDNGMVIFNLNDKNDKHVATITKIDDSIFVICSGSKIEKMRSALKGMPKKYKVTINGNNL